MEIMTIVIVVFAVIIGSHWICQHLSQDEIITREAAELMLLNTEQKQLILRDK